MNTAEPIASVFPGAVGRVVQALTAVWVGGAPGATVEDLADRAGVTAVRAHQAALRLSLLGLVGPVTGGEVPLNRLHVLWAPLAALADSRTLVETGVAAALAQVGIAPSSVEVTGRVVEGAATSPADTVDLTVTTDRPLDDDTRRTLRHDVFLRTGNACQVVTTAG